MLDSLYGCQVKRRAGTSKEEGTCLGLVLSMAEKKDENTLREKTKDNVETVKVKTFGNAVD